MMMLESVSVDDLYVYLCPDRYASLYQDLYLSLHRYIAIWEDGVHPVGEIRYIYDGARMFVYFRHQGSYQDAVYWISLEHFQRYVFAYHPVDLDRVYAYLKRYYNVFVLPCDVRSDVQRRVPDIGVGQLRYMGIGVHSEGADPTYAYRAIEGYYFISESTLRSFVS